MNAKHLQIDAWNIKILSCLSALSLPLLIIIAWQVKQIENIPLKIFSLFLSMCALAGIIYLILQKTKNKVEINEYNNLLKDRNRVIFFEKIKSYNTHRVFFLLKQSFILRIKYNNKNNLFWLNTPQHIADIKGIFKTKKTIPIPLDKHIYILSIIYIVLYVTIPFFALII